MTTHNANNERIKRKYVAYLKDAMGHSEATVDAVAKALTRFEENSKFRDFKRFHFELAVTFKRHLAEQTNQQTGAKLSKATLNSTLAQMRAFFHWLAGQPGYKSRPQYSDANYFNLSDKYVRVATAKREQTGLTLERATHVIHAMTFDTPIQQRNCALLAFTLLTGARDSAIASMKLKHVDVVAGCVHQDVREVKTKFSQTAEQFKAWSQNLGHEKVLKTLSKASLSAEVNSTMSATWPARPPTTRRDSLPCFISSRARAGR